MSANCFTSFLRKAQKMGRQEILGMLQARLSSIEQDQQMVVAGYTKNKDKFEDNSGPTGPHEVIL
jgi:hypothetical protein